MPISRDLIIYYRDPKYSKKWTPIEDLYWFEEQFVRDFDEDNNGYEFRFEIVHHWKCSNNECGFGFYNYDELDAVQAKCPSCGKTTTTRIKDPKKRR